LPALLIELGLLSADENDRLQELAAKAVATAEEFCTEPAGEVGSDRRVIPASKWPTPASLTEHVRGQAPSPADIHVLERDQVTSTIPMTYVQAIATATLNAMKRDERVFVLGEEVANLGGGAYRATQGIGEVYPERLINTPISETGFIGMAGGAAAVGMRPVVEVMFPDFALMASDQLFNQIGKLRHMYGGHASFPVIVRTRVASGFGYGGQHSMDPAGLFALFSGWRVMAPSNAFDYIGLFNTALTLADPVLIIEHGMLYPNEDRVPSDTSTYCVPYGSARVVRPGNAVTVLTYLNCVAKCQQAADELAAAGIEAEVIDLRTLDYTGMDYATLAASLAKTGAALIVEEAPRSLGIGGRLADELQARCFDTLDAPVGHYTAPDVPSPVSRALEDTFLPSVAGIRAAIERLARRQV
jgi:2-oxoisovalerate dehydrogenase E1 component